MNEPCDNEPPHLRVLGGWAIFGIRQIGLLEKGICCTDLHEGNLIWDGDDLVNVDYGGVVDIEYPRDWRMVPDALMSLLSRLDRDRAAAFRFGFLAQGGPVAHSIIDVIRRQFDFSAFHEEALDYIPPPRSDDELFSRRLQEANRDWRTLRGLLKMGSNAGRKPLLDDINHWRGERTRRNLGPSDADEFWYRRHLIAAAYHQSLYHTLEALLNMQGLYEVQARTDEAVGVGRFVLALVTKYAARIEPGYAAKIKANQERLVATLPAANVAVLDLIPPHMNVFRRIWALEDAIQGRLSRRDTF
jgi:hypothetical protein